MNRVSGGPDPHVYICCQWCECEHGGGAGGVGEELVVCVSPCSFVCVVGLKAAAGLEGL